MHIVAGYISVHCSPAIHANLNNERTLFLIALIFDLLEMAQAAPFTLDRFLRRKLRKRRQTLASAIIAAFLNGPMSNNTFGAYNVH
jgi:hypothetical protein